MESLVLPESYEALVEALGMGDSVRSRLMKFVQPVEDAERQLAEILALSGNSGRLIFVLGFPGSGKSTFLASLAWRPALAVHALNHVNASEFPLDEPLPSVLAALQGFGKEARQNKLRGRTVVVLDYLESLANLDEKEVKAFFRSLSGLLRQSPLLVVWPVTEQGDVESMVRFSKAVSGTLFVPGREVLKFSGPQIDKFPSIARDTISVLNPGQSHIDFGFTDGALDKLAEDFLSRALEDATLRQYILDLKKLWLENSGYLENVRKTVPSPTEIWFIVSYPEAEDVVGPFARKSKVVGEAWLANHGKLSEYIHENQRAADWDPQRLQLAISGAFKCRITFVTTNALVSSVIAYGDGLLDKQLLGNLRDLSPNSWAKKSTAVKALKTTPMVRQLRGETAKMGKRRSGTAKPAVAKAQPAYDRICSAVSSIGEASDNPINKALASALKDQLGGGVRVQAEVAHPWLPSVRPDILVSGAEHTTVCLEFHYTTRTDAYVIADYVLRKLDRYMKQLEHYLKSAAKR
jgi:hypothetical protein